MYLESFKTGSRSLDFMHMHLVKPQLSFSIKAIESYVQSPIPIKLSLYSQFSPCGHLTIADKSQPTLKYFFQNLDSLNIKQHYNKRKQGNHSSIGCKKKNFLLATGSFSGS